MQIFISHLSEQKPNVERLVAALKKEGVTAWFDRAEIGALDPITETVRQGIASSHVFLAWWFDGVDPQNKRRRYDESDPCRWELISALSHCAAEGSHALAARVFLVGPQEVLERPEVGRLGAVLLPQMSDPPLDDELNSLAKNLIEKGKSQTAPFGVAGAGGAGRPLPATIPPKADFVGRSRELLELHGALWGGGVGHEGSGTACRVVVGMGGQGKTTLIEEYARRFRLLYPGGVEVLRLQGEAGVSHPDSPGAEIDAMIDNALAQMVSAKKLDPGKGARWELRAALERHFSVANSEATPVGTRYPAYLWLVDDLPSAINAVQAQALLAPTDRGASLMSCRAKVPNLPGFRLEHLSPAEAVRLLTTLSERDLPAETAKKLVETVHHHALSVRLMGAALKKGQRPAFFLDPLAAGSVATLEAACHKMPSEFQQYPELKSIVGCLLRSLELLPAGHSGRALLGLLAELAAAPVPECLAEAGLGDDYPLALDAALGRGLVDFVNLAPKQDLRGLLLHPLLGEVVRFVENTYLPAGQAKRLAAVDAVLRGDLDKISEDAGHFRRDPLSSRLFPQAKHRAMAGLRAKRYGLALRYGVSCCLLGQLAEARAVEEQVVTVCTAVHGPEHPDTLGSMSNLANTLRDQGDYAGARAIQEPVLEVRRRTLGSEDRDTLASMSNLAATLSAQGDFIGAQALNEEVLAIRHRTLGLEHRDTLGSMSNLASTLRALGDFAGARALQESVLEAFRRSSGPEHPGLLTSMSNLANTLGNQGDHAGARGLYETVLEVRRRTLGAEHPDTLGCMNNLANTLRVQGDYAGARGLHETVLAIRRRTLGPEHPDTLGSIGNLAETLRSQGDFAGARPLFEEILETLPSTLGLEHYDTLGTIANLALALLGLAVPQADIDARIKPSLAAGLACQEAGVRKLWEELADLFGWR